MYGIAEGIHASGERRWIALNDFGAPAFRTPWAAWHFVTNRPEPRFKVIGSAR